MARNRQSVLLDLENYLPYWLASLSRLAVQRLQARLAVADLTIAEWRLMAVVATNEQTQAIAISRLTRLDQVAVHRAVKALMGKGLLRRKDCPADKRMKLLQLTQRGRSTYEQFVPAAMDIERELLDALSPAQRRNLRALLGTLYRLTKDNEWQG